MNALKRLMELMLIKIDNGVSEDNREFVIKILKDINKISYRELKKLQT